MLDLSSRIYEYPIVALDTETSGAFPLNSEICEVAAVKYFQGKIIDTFSSLVKISHKMPEEVIKIHGITDEMLKEAPSIDEVLPSLLSFIDKSVIIGHHIQFDAGFLAIEIEKAKLNFPQNIIICTSLLSRNLIPESPNHKLQTLISFLDLDQGTAHRALDDSKACLSLFHRCIEKMPDGSTLKELQEVQDIEMLWDHYALSKFSELPVGVSLVHAIKNQSTVFINYKASKTKADNYREVIPKGLVLHTKLSFLVAYCKKDAKDKRFYIDRIHDVK